MTKLDHIEKHRRDCMVVAMIVDGSTLAEAGSAHGITRQRAHQVREHFRKRGYIERDGDGYRWTATGRRRHGVMVYALDEPAEVVP